MVRRNLRGRRDGFPGFPLNSYSRHTVDGADCGIAGALNHDFVSRARDAAEGAVRVHEMNGIERSVHQLSWRQHVDDRPHAEDGHEKRHARRSPNRWAIGGIWIADDDSGSHDHQRSSSVGIQSTIVIQFSHDRLPLTMSEPETRWS